MEMTTMGYIGCRVEGFQNREQTRGAEALRAYFWPILVLLSLVAPYIVVLQHGSFLVFWGLSLENL